VTDLQERVIGVRMWLMGQALLRYQELWRGGWTTPRWRG